MSTHFLPLPEGTLGWLKNTRGLNTTTKPGALTCNQAMELAWGIESIRVFVAHVYQIYGYAIPEPLMVRIPNVKTVTIAEARRVLGKWQQHTWHLENAAPHESHVVAVERFLRSL